MKIIHVLPALTTGGAEALVVNYLIHLRKRGFETALIVLINNNSILYKTLLDHGVRVYILYQIQQNKPPFLPAGIFYKIINKLYIILFAKIMIRFILKQEKPAVIHFHLATASYFKCAAGLNCRLFYTYHTDIERYIKSYGNSWKKTMIKYTGKKNLITFVLNSKMKEDVCRLISNKNVYLLPNSIDIKEFKKKTYVREEFLKKVNLPSESFLLGHIARLNEVKNHKKSISVFSEISMRRQNAYLLLIGAGSSEYKQKLMEMSVNYGVGKRVIFLGERSDIAELVSIMDAAMLPSLNEGFPLTALEYQAHNIRSVFSLAVPESVICNANCFRISTEEPDQVWADYLLGDFEQSCVKDLMEFHIDNVLDRLLTYYNGSIR